MTAAGRAPAPAPAAPGRGRGRSASADGQVVGAMLVLTGVAWLLQRAEVVHLSWETMLSALLVVVGVGLVVTSRRRGGTGLVMVGILLTIVLAGTSSLDLGASALREGFGSIQRKPTTAADAAAADTVGIGHLEQDLSRLRVPQGETTRLHYTVGIGDLVLAVPEGIPVRVTADARIGEISLFGKTTKGSNVSDRHVDQAFDQGSPPESGQLVIEADVGIGMIRVERVARAGAVGEDAPAGADAPAGEDAPTGGERGPAGAERDDPPAGGELDDADPPGGQLDDAGPPSEQTEPAPGEAASEPPGRGGDATPR